MSAPTRVTLDTVDIPFGEARPTLRLALERDAEGEPLTLHLTMGWGEGREWQEEPGRGLSVPASVLAAVRVGLDTLETAGAS